MAADMVAAMARLGFDRFAVAGHDRGGRVAYRLALDHPRRVDRIAVLDVSRPQKRGRGPTRASPSPSGPGRSWPSLHRCPSACWPRCRTR
jgi:pimeloyl-ACP methyl ester carboxylesterase